MQVVNAELLKESRGSLKFILNNSAIAFFPTAQEHRSIKTHGLSYEDDYRGNAVGGLISPERVEIRFHSAYSETHIRTLWARVLAVPDIAQAALGPPYYQGRKTTK